jgi:RimJ/RimL family protein N-acetyltransferase
LNLDNLITYDNGFTEWDILCFYRDLEFKEDIFYNVKDLEKFDCVRYFRQAKIHLGFIDSKCIGAFWITGWNHLNRSGFFNFGSTGVIKDHFDKLQIGKEGLKRILDRPEYQLLYGETSVSNTRVLAISEYYGFVKVGNIPNAHWNAKLDKFEDTVMMFITKDLLR